MQFITIRFFVYTLQKYNFSLKYTNKMVFFSFFASFFLQSERIYITVGLFHLVFNAFG